MQAAGNVTKPAVYIYGTDKKQRLLQRVNDAGR